jgi:hypothetical protein
MCKNVARSRLEVTTVSKSRMSSRLKQRLEIPRYSKQKHKARSVPAPVSSQNPGSEEQGQAVDDAAQRRDEPAASADIMTEAPVGTGNPQEVHDAEIRHQAYLKWEAAGRPPGDGREFWLAAEREL